MTFVRTERLQAAKYFGSSVCVQKERTFICVDGDIRNNITAHQDQWCHATTQAVKCQQPRLNLNSNHANEWPYHRIYKTLTIICQFWGFHSSISVSLPLLIPLNFPYSVAFKSLLNCILVFKLYLKTPWLTVNWLSWFYSIVLAENMQNNL
jgi:hypothetical protein